MTSQKAENMLNLALDATPEERGKSLQLDVGYHPEERTWDLIVKYSGELEPVRTLAKRVVELMNEYAVITIQEPQIEALAGLAQIEYIEKPKRLFFQVVNGKRVSCIRSVQDAPFSLSGQGVLVAVLDSGIDYTLPEFMDDKGNTRIAAIWDQSLEPRQELGEQPPEGYDRGVEYTREDLARKGQTLRTRDISGHGTAVASIAAGKTGVAPEAQLIVVKLGTPEREGFPRTTELMMGLDYVIRRALEYRMPVAVNISFGYPLVMALIL